MSSVLCNFNPTPNPNPDPTNEGLSTGAIIGIVAGGVVLVGGIGLAIYKVIKPRKAGAYQQFSQNP
jgi:hypothetical protein